MADVTGSAGSPPVALLDENGVALLDELSLNLYDDSGSQGQILSSVLLVAAGHVETTFLIPVSGRLGTALVLQEDGASGILTEASDRVSLDEDSAYAGTVDAATCIATGLANFSVVNGTLGLTYAATDRLLFDSLTVSNRLLLEDGVSTFVLEGVVGYQLPTVGIAAQGNVTSLGAPSGAASYTLGTVLLSATGINYGKRTGALAATLAGVGQVASANVIQEIAHGGHRGNVNHPTPGHRDAPVTVVKGRRAATILTPGTRHG